MKKGRIVFSIIVILILIIIGISICNNQELKTIKSEKELNNILNNRHSDDIPLGIRILTMPFSVIVEDSYRTQNWNDVKTYTNSKGSLDIIDEGITADSTPSSTKDYSKTNIQVEGVDEADIIKTDGDYIYSISENNVIITNAKDSKNTKIESTINGEKTIPTDLLLYKDKLVVISTEITSTRSDRGRYSWYREPDRNTIVNIYDISNKEKPKVKKSFKLKEEYNTTRCIDGKLYIFANGYLRKHNNKVDREYVEDHKTKEIELKNIKYLKNKKQTNQTLIAEVDLNKVKEDIKLSSYLIDITEAYISKKNIYLLDQAYSNEGPEIKDLFGLKGVFGFFEKFDTEYNEKTTIYKFNIDNNEGIKFQTSNKVEGKIINQYSLDEKDENLRIALETEEGSNITVLDKKLKLLGKTDEVAEGEKMYASRFMGDKAYLVTYQNTDPLFVIDLKNPKAPKVLGELKIPGYSTYLHPYDENHLIGIGMDTRERMYKDSNGRVTSTWTETVGMKMSLFDVTDVENPVEIDHTTIGDRRTVSAILTNPKALLFSKEKELLAIPVNNYAEDFSAKESEEYDEEIDNFTDKKNYLSEGYLVYKVNLEGFKLKGKIVHDKNKYNDYYYYYDTKLLRGLYIENNLYTVSENAIKVNDLETLKEINSIKVKGEK